jgi:hypothetical protein
MLRKDFEILYPYIDNETWCICFMKEYSNSKNISSLEEKKDSKEKIIK